VYDPAANTALSASAIGSTGGSQPHENMSPFLVLNFCIALQGIFPSRN
jgi:microcystin-dependent protein